MRPGERPGGHLRDPLAALAAVTWIALGAGLAAGPPAWRSSPSYAVIRDVLPLRVWGCIAIAIGTLELVAQVVTVDAVEYRRLPFVVGAGVALGWLVSFLIAAAAGELTSVPALWLLLAGVQALLARRRLWSPR